MKIDSEIDVAILGAVSQEIRGLTEFLRGSRVYPFRCQTIWVGQYSNLTLLIGTTGLGKVNAAITAASILEHFSVAQLWNVGCSGAYPGGPLKVGDVLITDEALCGDEGILTLDSVLPVSAIGIPLIACDGAEYHDALPMRWAGGLRAVMAKIPAGVYRQMREVPLSRAYLCTQERLQEHQRSGTGDTTANSLSPPAFHWLDDDRHQSDQDVFRLVHGSTLTVSMTSGDHEVATRRFQTYGAFAENMEGSAVVQACLRFNIPVMECRGISNIAGVRSKEFWQLEKSIAHCHGIVINCLEALVSMKLSE